jgi:glycosyltransferase involved in cell wall biosynthesis
VDALVVSHAAIRASNRSVYRRLAARGARVTVVVPERWYSVLGGVLRAEPEPEDSPIRLAVRKRVGKTHTNLYMLWPGIGDLIGRRSESAIYVDEDPPGFMALQSALTAARSRVGLVILSLQNILKRYPAPFNAIQRYVFTRAGACVASTHECEKVIRLRGYEGPVTIMRFAYDLAPMSAYARDQIAQRHGFRRPAVGFIGRLVHEKGVDVLLRAAHRLLKVHVVIGGDGPQRGALQGLAEELNLSDRVRFLGNLSPEEAIREVGAFDVCALPSRTNSFCKEQVGHVPIEAMAQGVPVVGSRSESIAETIGDAGLLFPEEGIAELAQCIASALSSPLRDELTTRGLARARDEYSLDQAAAALDGALHRSIESAA